MGELNTARIVAGVPDEREVSHLTTEPQGHSDSVGSLGTVTVTEHPVREGLASRAEITRARLLGGSRPLKTAGSVVAFRLGIEPLLDAHHTDTVSMRRTGNRASITDWKPPW